MYGEKLFREPLLAAIIAAASCAVTVVKLS